MATAQKCRNGNEDTQESHYLVVVLIDNVTTVLTIFLVRYQRGTSCKLLFGLFGRQPD